MYLVIATKQWTRDWHLCSVQKQ